MRHPSGPPGTCRGIPAKRVTELLAKATARLGREFTRAELRAALAKEDATLSPEEQKALEFVFVRAVQPITVGEGKFLLPAEAQKLIKHRLYRLPTTRLNLADIMQLTALLEGVEGLTPNLQQTLKRGKVALKALGVRPSLHRTAPEGEQG